MATIAENTKDHTIISDALNRIVKRGDIKYAKSVLWQEMMKLYDFKDIDTEVDKDEKVNEQDEKNDNVAKKSRLSQLTDITHNEMCSSGHGRWNQEYDNKHMKDATCIQCESTYKTKFCWDCCDYAQSETGQLAKTFAAKHTYCEKCRIQNSGIIREKIKMDKFKAAVIRKELIDNPSLELDVICNMPRKAALDTLIWDINHLKPVKRAQWSLFMMDMDYLKTWNSCLGHSHTDKLIKKIGDVMKKYVKRINDGLEKSGYDMVLEKAFVYRTGGDEFAVVIRTGKNYAFNVEFGKFFLRMKAEINALAQNIQELIPTENEWLKTQDKLSDAKD
eukprot:93186_1